MSDKSIIKGKSLIERIRGERANKRSFSKKSSNYSGGYEIVMQGDPIFGYRPVFVSYGGRRNE